jgi:hypothetical protein
MLPHGRSYQGDGVSQSGPQLLDSKICMRKDSDHEGTFPRNIS